jgi:ABC-type antimicrobial peptide transport system permease subunit
MVIGEGLRLLIPGLAVGVAGALSLSGLLRNVLYGVRPADPLTIVAVAVVLGVAALVASAVPARQAARIDPQTAMRTE